MQLYKTVLLPSAATQKQVLLLMSTDFTTTIIFLIPTALEHIKPESLKVGCVPVNTVGFGANDTVNITVVGKLDIHVFNTAST